MRPLMCLLAAFSVMLFSIQAHAQELTPGFWTSKHRHTPPDLGGVQRLRFLTTGDFFPFNYFDETGRLSGFHIDLVRQICAELELTDICQIQALPWEELEEAAQKGDGEAIVAGLSISAENRRDFIFSRAYLQFPARFVFRHAIMPGEAIHPPVSGRKVGVIDDSAHEALLRDIFPDAKVVAYSNRAWMLEDLANGALEAVFADGMRLSFWLAGADAERCCGFSGGPYFASEYFGHGLAIAIPKGRSELAQAIDYALHEINAQGGLEELYKRYFPVSFY